MSTKVARRWSRAAWPLVGAALLALLGCSAAEERRDDDSPIPWNTPERWEQQPNFGAPFTW